MNSSTKQSAKPARQQPLERHRSELETAAFQAAVDFYRLDEPERGRARAQPAAIGADPAAIHSSQ